MNDLKDNIKFNYLYRDAGNYKNYGSMVFSNPYQLTLEEITSEIRKRLIDSEYFVASEVDIPSLFFENSSELDHTWHEFSNVETTAEESDNNKTISEFINHLSMVLH